ncbi:proton-coupled amino acid transporter 2-like isoform X2 [Physella acuta]|uniref:proton-coupled amino acid transporter 2-like isoform X2 n=1 Tax=Physella acuta TaxID=109671 RepID=UPI0027DB487A|nr:proton-coupled amino acid transporter 2-like isoform X2 [Physella acuta]
MKANASERRISSRKNLLSMPLVQREEKEMCSRVTHTLTNAFSNVLSAPFPENNQNYDLNEDISTSLISKNRTKCMKENYESHKEASRQSLQSTHSILEYTENRTVLKCSNMQTLMNLLKGTAGTGILSLPFAFKNSGLWTGFGLFLIIALVAVHCMHILSDSSNRLEQRYVSNTLICIMQCGFCCVYIAWASVTIKEVLDQYWPSSPNVRVYEVTVFLLLLPYVMIRSLKILAVFSAVANVIYLVGLIVILQYMLQDLPNQKERPVFKSWSSLTMFFGTSVYSFESICLIIPLRNRMQNVSDFGGWSGVLSLAMVIVTAMYTAVGFYGYLKFGEDSAAAITLNLPVKQILYQLVNVSFAVAVFISVAVQFYVPINVVWPVIENWFLHRTSSPAFQVLEYLTRAVLLIIIFSIATLAPHIELLMALFGSFCGGLMSIIIPVFVEMLTLYGDEELTALVLAKDVFLLCFGLLGLTTGTYTAMLDISQTF